ncbi:KGK domain-containing protein [Nostoc sp.]|uniref:KGK domain-containing protein n=1 Tax=Nostoc sp. TaxID=1180 RepID=UPI002FFC7375
MSSPRQKLSSSSNEGKKFSDEKYRFDFSDQDRFNLDDEDAVFNFSSQAFGTPPMLKFKDLMQAISSWIKRHEAPEWKWFSEEGCKCEFLLIKGGGWQKGRFRFRLEFIPDDPEAFLKNSPVEPEKTQSPLDDLRSHLNPE